MANYVQVRLNWGNITWPTYSLSVNNTDWTNLWVLAGAVLGGTLLGAGTSLLKPADLNNILNIFKPSGSSGIQNIAHKIDILPENQWVRRIAISHYKRTKDNFFFLMLKNIITTSMQCHPCHFSSGVSCGSHRANSCALCPFDGKGKYYGAGWCNGRCQWRALTGVVKAPAPEGVCIPRSG